jgi:hypothetical protein
MAYGSDTDNTGSAVHNFGSFGFVATPAVYGVTGRMTFIVNEGDSVFGLDNGGAPVLQWPTAEQLVNRSWKRIR